MKKQKTIFLLKIYMFIVMILTVFGLCAFYENKHIKFLGYSSGFLALFLGICLYMLFRYVYFNIHDRRLKICASVLAIIFSFLYYFGELGNNYANSTIPENFVFIAYSIIKVLSYYIIFKNTIALLFYKASKYKYINIRNNLLNADKKSFIIVSLIFFLSYIPFFLHHYPGAIQYDAINSLEQIAGLGYYTNHHPIICTLYLGFFWKVGLVVFNNANIGIALYTLSHLIICSLVFSYLLFYLAKREVDYRDRLVTFLVLLLNPLNGLFAIRIEKSFFFHLFMAVFITLLIDIIYEKEKFFRKKGRCILFSILILLISLIRNNGIYVFILTFLFMLIFNFKLWKKSIIVFLVPIIGYYIFTGPILTKLNIYKDDSTREMFSIPIQQYARIIKYNKRTLNKSEYKSIHKYIKLSDKDISSKYNSLISDDIKFNSNTNNLKKNKTKVIINYFQLLFKYPIDTFSSFLFNSYGFYSPNSINIWGLHNYRIETENVLNNKINYDKGKVKNELDISNGNYFKIYPRPLLDIKIIDSINNSISKMNIPIFSVTIFSIGFYFFCLIFCIMYCIYRKLYSKLLIFAPMVFLWLTSIAGPVVDWRYIYSFMICIPLYIGIVFFSKKFEGGKNEKK